MFGPMFIDQNLPICQYVEYQNYSYGSCVFIYLLLPRILYDLIPEFYPLPINYTFTKYPSSYPSGRKKYSFHSSSLLFLTKGEFL
jgi:hypothetical protein